ncbi:Structure-specific endonuclease subunit SLX4 [Bagarius yarrelli]|uniref:Structure-specific endonuclease subunit SLX4 n=1 Tax=Bagarius yarrelli TaxID=175774 RepID=A0A556TTX9_BAGYA|nr:Structure-specific endonuclease subunit SLX4 [Bagarius yarrelli]
MDDSDQDFSFLCSRLLKRVRRKGGESGDEKKTVVKDGGEDEDSGSRIQSRIKAPSKRKREKKGEVPSKNTDKIHAETREHEGSEVALEDQKEQKMRAKEKVLSRMQRFKRATPPRLMHEEEKCVVPPAEIGSLPTQDPVEKQDGDRLLAQRLQQQLDGEAESQAVVDVEDGGLFFCQLCYKDLSAMNHQLRTQHINRCLDQHESSTSRVPAPVRPRIPECPICGRGFKSEKTRSTHLKRCSANMGVSPAELLKALQKQAAEQENRQQAGGSSDTSDSSKPAKKKARKKAPHLDEDTMVALALSRSLLEQEKERVKDWQAGPTSLVQGKNRVKRRKGDPAAPPPLLLVQDPQNAQNRIQERVSSLLLLPRPPTPPTPTLLPSSLFTNTLLWLKSALSGGGPASLSEFYTAELKEFIQPEILAEEKNCSLSEVTPVKQCPLSSSESTRAPEQVDDSAPHHPITPSSSIYGTQALADLVDLAEEGMTLTQHKSTDADPPLSGFVPEPTETQRPPIISTSVSRLCSDLRSMVNNPQLSDVQLQVDSGDVYFVHSFMLYSRCPLLANMVHDTGFGVQEEGFPQARRVLLNDVSGEAVYALLQYLYTAVCHLTHSLLPDVLQLASRFGLSELQQQCERYTGNPAEDLTEQECGDSPAHEHATEPQQSLVDTQFLELLRSMWEHEDVDSEEVGGALIRMQGVGEVGGGDRETKDDVVDEDELDEIYQFAATQRKMVTEAEKSADRRSEEEEPVEGVSDDRFGAEERHEGMQNVKMEDVRRGANVKLNLKSNTCVVQSRALDASLDRSDNHLFSESWGKYTEPSQTQTRRSDRKDASNLRHMTLVSEVIDLSISPPQETGEPARSQFPVAGLSPGETPDQNEAVQQASTSGGLKAPGIPNVTLELWSKPPPTSSLMPEVTNTLPSDTKGKLYSSSPSRSQPELIVLSDSSDDMEPDLPDQDSSRCSAPKPPTSSPSRLSLRYTRIKAKETVEFFPEKSRETTNSVHSESFRSEHVSNENPLDGSAEVHG